MVPLSHQFQVLVQQVGVPLWRLRASGKGHILRLGNPSALGFSWGTGRGASGSLWCLLENEIRNMQAERENPGPVSHPFSCCSLWGPFSLKSPQPFISSWAHSVSCSFSFSVFLVSASKKPLPPTPEDNRVSEAQGLGSGRRGPGHLKLLLWCHPAWVSHLLRFLNPDLISMQLNSTLWVSWAQIVSWEGPGKMTTQLAKSSLHKHFSVSYCASKYLD